ncbi:MAG: OsmC family protein [Candidatus Magnetobacterium sp. LHC-1]|nr:OsmC family protein [Nitrospirota bacterium]
MTDEPEIQDLEGSLGSYKAKVATTFKGTLTWDKDLIFLGRTQKGYEIDYDANVEWGCQPSEPVMMSLAACISTDCLMFLQKMKATITAMKTNITGIKQESPPHYFTGFDIMLYITGKNLTEKKVDRALDLSINKYCGVYHSLRRDIKLNVKYELTKEE